MATTDAGLAATAVNCLVNANVGVALLHGIDRFESGDVSDVDLVSSVPASAALKMAAPLWRQSGLYPVVHWPYDVGGTGTIFLSTVGATDGVQLDLLHDPEGIGKYGIRIGSMLDDVIVSGEIPEVDRTSSLIYQWNKRVVKGQSERLSSIRDDAVEVGPAALKEASVKLTGSESVALEILGRLPPSRASGSSVSLPAEIRRKLRRARSPIGFWVHVPTLEAAEGVAARFARFLPSVWSGSCPGRWAPTWYATTVWPTIIRPGVCVSSGPTHAYPRPFVLDGKDPDLLCRSVVSTMTDRLVV